MSEADTFFRTPSFASKLKHDIYRRYLAPAYRVIAAGTRLEVLSADLLAGKGVYDDGTPASPMIAAQLAARQAGSPLPRVICFNVERNRQNFDALSFNLRGFPTTLVLNRHGDWRRHLGELRELLEHRAGVIFMDPYGLGIDLTEIVDLIAEIGQRPRDLILRLDMQTLQRIVGAKRRHDEERDAAAVYGGDIGMPVVEDFKTADRILGGVWWRRYIVDGVLPEEAFAPLVAEYCRLLETLGVDTGPRRKTAAVPIPFRLGGDTFYYLILVTRTGKAITLFNDAIEGAFGAVYRAGEPAPRDATLRSNGILFEELRPAALTYEERQQELLMQMEAEVASFIERRPWGATFQEVHEEMARVHLGLFTATHLRTLIKQLCGRGAIDPDATALSGSTRLRSTRRAARDTTG